MKRSIQILILAALAATLVITPQAISQESGEQEIVFEEGLNDYTGARDTSIYSENENTNGGGQHIFSGITARGDERRALVAFDLSEIPVGSEITSVRLQLTVSRTRAGNPPSTLHRLTADWGEGEADAAGQEGRGTPSSEGDTTWLENFKGESSWETQGGDFVATASATTDAGAVNTKVIFKTDMMIDDVQGWVDNPDSNFGWIIITDGTAKRFISSDNDRVDENVRPQLTITYIPGDGNGENEEDEE